MAKARAKKPSPKPAPKLSHVDKKSDARMVDVSEKAETVSNRSNHRGSPETRGPRPAP